MSRRKFAESIDMLPSTLGNYEDENRIPNVVNAWRVVKGFWKLNVKCTFEDVFPPNSYRTKKTSKQLKEQ